MKASVRRRCSRHDLAGCGANGLPPPSPRARSAVDAARGLRSQAGASAVEPREEPPSSFIIEAAQLGAIGSGMTEAESERWPPEEADPQPPLRPYQVFRERLGASHRGCVRRSRPRPHR
jgi:hypothetical protein